MSKPLLLDVADKVAEWFPELGGRSIAVSEADITRENIPTLPLAMVALLNVGGDWNWKAANARQNLFDEFVLDFWLEPVKIKKSNGSETPFWAFYDYEAFRDRLLSQAIGYEGPRGQRLDFIGMTIESDQLAVVLSFRFRARFAWCRNEEPAEASPERKDGAPIAAGTIITAVCAPKAIYCGPAFDTQQQKECEPCSSE